jgi:hypothetical protein
VLSSVTSHAIVMSFASVVARHPTDGDGNSRGWMWSTE